MTRIKVVWIVSMCEIGLAGCGGSEDGGGNGGGGAGGDGEARACTPGATQGCACLGGVQGVQTCNEAGSGYSACDCPEPPDDGEARVCVPGQTQDCTCPNGLHGSQTCTADGAAFGACQCVEPEPGCTDECGRGEVECAGAGYRLCRDTGNNGCIEWTEIEPCPRGTSCQEGECKPDEPECRDECQDGRVQCAGGGVQACGDFTADGCTEWSAPEPCSPGEVCDGGECVPRGVGGDCEAQEDCGADNICYFGTCTAAYGRLYTVMLNTAVVPGTNPDGEAWDPFGGAPDLLVVAETNGESYQFTTVWDSFAPSWFETWDVVIRRGAAFSFALWDEDADDPDLAGSWAFRDGMPLAVLQGGVFSGTSEDGRTSVDFSIWPTE